MLVAVCTRSLFAFHAFPFIFPTTTIFRQVLYILAFRTSPIASTERKSFCSHFIQFLHITHILNPKFQVVGVCYCHCSCRCCTLSISLSLSLPLSIQPYLNISLTHTVFIVVVGVGVVVAVRHHCEYYRVVYYILHLN